jgi:energy-converting hydrogenase Eha subunit B
MLRANFLFDIVQTMMVNCLEEDAWLNALIVDAMLPMPEKAGRWPAAQTRVERGLN